MKIIDYYPLASTNGFTVEPYYDGFAVQNRDKGLVCDGGSVRKYSCHRGAKERAAKLFRKAYPDTKPEDVIDLRDVNERVSARRYYR